jgi:hypothetical protein
MRPTAREFSDDDDSGEVGSAAEERIAEARQRTVGTRLLIAIPILIAGFVVSLLLARHVDFGVTYHRPPSAEIIGAGAVVAGALMCLVTLTLAYRSGAMRRNRRSPLWAMPAARRRSLSRQVRRNRLDDDGDLADARMLARATIDRRYMSWLNTSVAVVFLGNMLITQSATIVVVYAIGATANAAAAVASNWYISLAERFLDENPAQTVH